MSKDESEDLDQRQELEKQRVESSFQCRKNYDRNPHTTTFLTLPRELRQQILLDTFDAVEPMPNISNLNASKRLGDMHDWAVVLSSADMRIRTDVSYVLSQWGKEFEQWHTLELHKVDDKLDRVGRLSERLSAMPPFGTTPPFPCILGIMMYMQHSRLLTEVNTTLGLYD